jgi:threonine dehydrogenase-like Zn-dependent dehydrogenase
MRQAVLLAPKKIEFREVPAPRAEDLKGNEILLNIKKIGICGSEIHSYHGLHPATFYPVVQGHEDYLKAVEEIAKGTIKLAPLVSNRFPFDRYDEAYRFIDANRETCMKVIVDLEA